MTGRATNQAIAAAEPAEGDSDAVRIRHQLDAWANASSRTPRLVTTAAEDPGVVPSGKAPPAAPKRSRAASATGRAKAARATKASKAKATEATRADVEPETPAAPAEPLTVSTAPAVPEAVP